MEFAVSLADIGTRFATYRTAIGITYEQALHALIGLRDRFCGGQAGVEYKLATTWRVRGRRTRSGPSDRGSFLAARRKGWTTPSSDWTSRPALT
jgi:hypothetical protein